MGILAQWIVGVVVAGLVAAAGICAVPIFMRRKMWVVRIICMVLSAVVIGGGVVGLRYTQAFNGFLDKVSSTIVDEDVEEEERGLIERPFILYISGIDSRDGYKEEALSDVNILVVVNPSKGKILLASIPRDTYVQLHGTEGLKDKLTHAGFYGVNMSRATLEDFLGVRIDRTLKVSFETVVEVVDELDGVEIYSDTTMNLKSERGGKMCYYVEGRQMVDGECALRFARERKTYNTGDLHRGANQQEVLTAIIQKLTGSKKYLLKAPEILEVAADSFETSLTRDEITAFIRKQLADGTDWQIESMGLDGEGTYELTYSLENMGPLYVMIPDEGSKAEMVKKIREYLGEEVTDDAVDEAVNKEAADEAE